MIWHTWATYKPDHSIAVLAYNKAWIDEDFNPHGIRIGFRNGDNDFTSAHWWADQDCYMTISHGECDGNLSFSDGIKENIEPELWASLDILTTKLPR